MARAASTSPLRGSRRRTLATLRVRLMCNSRERETAKNGRATSSDQVGAGFACQYRREALPIAEDGSNSTAWLRPVQDTSINRETGQLLIAPLIFHCASSDPERCTPKTGQTHCANQF